MRPSRSSSGLPASTASRPSSGWTTGPSSPPRPLRGGASVPRSPPPHRAGLPLAEPLDRVVQRPLSRRGARLRAVQLDPRGASDRRRLARYLQPLSPALLARDAGAGGLRRALASRPHGGGGHGLIDAPAGYGSRRPMTPGNLDE